jgi:hydrogenase expression/formation protein HypC
LSFEVPGKILEEHTVRNNRLGLVAFGDMRRPIFLDLVPDAHVGDYVRVHVGFATERVSAEEAQHEYEALQISGHLQTMEADMQAEESSPPTTRRQKRP